MAIAFVRFAAGSFSNTTSHTFAVNCTGGDYLLVKVTSQGGSANITGVTYSGVAMAYVGENAPSATTNIAWYELVAPASGSNNVVISKTAGTYGVADAVVFSGVDQTTPSDNLTASRELPSASPNGDVTISTPSVSANSVMVVANGIQGGGANVTAGTGLTLAGASDFEASTKMWYSGTLTAGAPDLHLTSSAFDSDYVGAHRLELLAAAGGGGGTVIPVLMNQYRQRWN
jgi:hypothetical protein